MSEKMYDNDILLADTDTKVTHRGKSGANTAILIALASGKTIRDTAAECGVSESLIYRRLKKPQFLAKLERARGRMLDAALGSLTMASQEAGVVLRELMKDNAPLVRLGAARACLEYGLSLRKQSQFERRMQLVEQRLAEKSHEPGITIDEGREGTDTQPHALQLPDSSATDPG